MVTRLSVVNECLAVMGETPLTSLEDDHEYKGAILTKLDEELARVQAKEWWFNTENLTLRVDASDRRVYTPGDSGGVIVFKERPWLTVRGRTVYDLKNGTDKFEAGLTFEARWRRVLPLDLLPTLAAAVIAINVLEWFQLQYDGDQTKTRNIQARKVELVGDLTAEHIRQRGVNLFDANIRLSRIRTTIRRFTRY